MRRRYRSLSDVKCELEMTPMIDVTFQLLIFFMCTLRFKTLEGKLNAYLPKDVGVNVAPAEQKPVVEITLRVRREGERIEPGDADPPIPWDGTGRYVYDATRTIEYAVGPRKTTDLAELERLLRQMHAAEPDLPLTIDARPGILHAEVVKVLDVALETDFQEITFVGAHDAPPAPAPVAR